MSVVRIIEGPYYRGYFYKECTGIFPGPSELSVLERCPYNREVSVRRGSTVIGAWFGQGQSSLRVSSVVSRVTLREKTL